MKELRIGVVGYVVENFDVSKARGMVKDAYDILDKEYPDYSKTVVSGLTDVGILGLAYREAVKRKWRTAGVACSKAKGLKWFPVDEHTIFGSQWADESQKFLDSIDALVRIGGGEQSHREIEKVKSMGKRILEYELDLI